MGAIHGYDVELHDRRLLKVVRGLSATRPTWLARLRIDVAQDPGRKEGAKSRVGADQY
jgi:hypothetical protein